MYEHIEHYRNYPPKIYYRFKFFSPICSGYTKLPKGFSQNHSNIIYLPIYLLVFITITASSLPKMLYLITYIIKINNFFSSFQQRKIDITN